MKAALAFALVALIPASLDPAPAAGPQWLRLCRHGGAVQFIPASRPQTPASPGCPGCAKGCRADPRRRARRLTGVDREQ